MDDEKYMKLAILEAKKALINEDIPIGAVIVYEDKVIAKGYNKRNLKKNVLYHAEIIAIYKACTYMKDWRLEDTTMYVTVEPCPMCAGAILQARIPTVVFGAENKKAGSAKSVVNLFDNPSFNHQVVTRQVLSEPCGRLMMDFFANLREKDKNDRDI